MTDRCCLLAARLRALAGRATALVARAVSEGMDRGDGPAVAASSSRTARAKPPAQPRSSSPASGPTVFLPALIDPPVDCDPGLAKRGNFNVRHGLQTMDCPFDGQCQTRGREPRRTRLARWVSNSPCAEYGALQANASGAAVLRPARGQWHSLRLCTRASVTSQAQRRSGLLLAGAQSKLTTARCREAWQLPFPTPR